MIEIDINSDVGEGVGNEAQLMPLISSCNIACGGHVGNESTMRKTIQLAQRNKVKIGAHPSYPDHENFGRKVIEISSDALIASLRAQLHGFINILYEEGAELNHIKPHGALYNEIVKNKSLANTFLDAISNYQSTPLYIPFQSVIANEATKRGKTILFEAFADRNYHIDLSLVSRKDKNALIENPKKVLAHLLSMVRDSAVITLKGDKIPIKAGTFCVHGDTSSALEILMYLHKELPNHNIQIAK